MRTRYNIPDAQAGLIAGLEAKYAHLGLRFDTGFVGSVPVQAHGRIGRRNFYFRFRHDIAALKVGSPEHRREAGQDKHAARKARRALRHGVDSSFDRYLLEDQLRRDSSPDLRWFPSRVTRYASIWPVTGEEYAGTLEDDEAADLFVRLLESLQPVAQNPARHKSIRQITSRSWTAPMEPHRVVIRKKLNLRRR